MTVQGSLYRSMRPAFRGPWCRRAILALAVASLALAAGEEPSQDLRQMSLEEILKVKLTVATRTETTLEEAPSVVSVITAEDIRRMGARDLRDVIRTVPGFELGIRSLGYPEFGLRGIMTDNSEKVQILLDGQPVNEDLEGSAPSSSATSPWTTWSGSRSSAAPGRPCTAPMPSWASSASSPRPRPHRARP